MSSGGTVDAKGVENKTDETGLELSTIEEIIDDARNGRMFILVDDEDRENEGDLIIPAQMTTPEAVNFMAQHGRGLICLALTAERCDDLGLRPMARRNETAMQTAFTVSIEARDGVDTGISVDDRARTIAVAINCTDPDALVSPGHVFPLRARPGGVLARAGHTEAGVDIARLAGLNPSAVICEIMKDDGSMARLPDLIRFAGRHGLKIATIRDLIAYRCRHDHIIEKRSSARISSRWGGDWQAFGFTNKITGSTAVAMVMGTIDPARPALVRMHALDVIADAFGSEQRRPADLLRRAIEAITSEGAGIIVLLGQTSPDAVAALLNSYSNQPGGERHGEESGHLRDYGFGAQLLAELGVHRMVLLTNSENSPVALEGFGLSIVGKRALG